MDSHAHPSHVLRARPIVAALAVPQCRYDSAAGAPGGAARRRVQAVEGTLASDLAVGRFGVHLARHPAADVYP